MRVVQVTRSRAAVAASAADVPVADAVITSLADLPEAVAAVDR
jgi:hypothetical protein